MLIAKEKRKENIAEYILYLWQMEDLLRALKLEETQIYNTLVAPLAVDEDVKKQVLAWYMGIVQLLQFEKKEQSGHSSHSLHLINDVNDIHLYLLENNRDEQYTELYQNAKPAIDAFREKIGNSKENDIAISFHALYARMLLGMKKQEISAETQEAITSISKMIAYLADKYRKIETGEEKYGD